MGHAPKEWDAASYHRVSEPQFAWGLRVLERLELAGDECVMDAGCGTGRLTEQLLERLPRGRVIAVDASQKMLAKAAQTLLPRYAGRVEFVEADLGRYRNAGAGRVDVVFSTATFHWIADHAGLFAALHSHLKPGGTLLAQCGGSGNLSRARAVAGRLMREAPWRGYFADWQEPWYYAGAEETAELLRGAGFTAVTTGIEAAPTPFAGAEAYREFLRTVVLRVHLEKITDAGLAGKFLERVVQAGGPGFELDYQRLNMRGIRAAVP